MTIPHQTKSFRSLGFKSRVDDARYTWFRDGSPNYVPPVFDLLTDEEWTVIDDWYTETDLLHKNSTGECNIPAMSLLMGFIMGNNISRVVQLGHHIGFSTLLLGFMMRRMGHETGVFSVDINSEVTSYVNKWLLNANLRRHVHLVVNDSAEEGMPRLAEKYLGGAPQLIFIDSSHNYSHTLRELDLWYDHLQPGGLILLHDVSTFASDFGTLGGVKKAVEEWKEKNNSLYFGLNHFATKNHYGDKIVYRDPCGLGLIQKPS